MFQSFQQSDADDELAVYDIMIPYTPIIGLHFIAQCHKYYIFCTPIDCILIIDSRRLYFEVSKSLGVKIFVVAVAIIDETCNVGGRRSTGSLQPNKDLHHTIDFSVRGRYQIFYDLSFEATCSWAMG